MKKSFWKNIFRTIRESIGRYVALCLIVMLGVIFYVGLKITTVDMIDTANDFYADTNFYDYLLVSNVGFDRDAVNNIKNDNLNYIEGAVYQDLISKDHNEKESVIRFHSITQNVNRLVVVKGRLPENNNECVVDARYYNESAIGTVISISDNNSEDNLKKIKNREFTVVGLVDSPIYLSYQRGTTNVGNGQISSFAYVDFDAFDLNYYMTLFVDIDDEEFIYSDIYDDTIDKYIDEYKAFAEQSANEYSDKIKQLYQLTGQDVSKLPEVNAQVLLRKDNLGYRTFKDNADIVKSIAYIFPVFFVLVAALVCITTMSRMIEEERTQIGVFKALGYSYGNIFSKYIIYSLSASLIGAVSGFYLGGYIFPSVIWKAYMLMYTFTDHLNIINDFRLLLASLIVSVAVLVGSTVITCNSCIKEVPASLIRPKAPPAGKRVLLENIKFIWNRFKFDTKISIRNCFRYKKRFFMMLIGIAGCTSLVIIGFGIKDSISNICDLQYGEIEKYDYLIACDSERTFSDTFMLEKELNKYTSEYVKISRINSNVIADDGKKTFSLVVYEDFNRLDKFVNFSDNNIKISEAEDGKILISRNFAESLKKEKGDIITIEFDNLSRHDYVIGGIYDNYVNNYIYMSDKTYLEGSKQECDYNCYYALCAGDNVYENSSDISNIEKVVSVSVTRSTRDYFNEMVKSLNGIVYLVIACAAILAFVVLYNLNNINIMEREREIATIKVLGFFKNEANMYVFRENIILTVFGIICGMPLGFVMHRLIMDKIKVDMICFDVHIEPLSYVYSSLITIMFSIIVDFVMRRKIADINMSESLKAIE